MGEERESGRVIGRPISLSSISLLFLTSFFGRTFVTTVVTEGETQERKRENGRHAHSYIYKNESFIMSNGNDTQQARQTLRVRKGEKDSLEGKKRESTSHSSLPPSSHLISHHDNPKIETNCKKKSQTTHSPDSGRPEEKNEWIENRDSLCLFLPPSLNERRKKNLVSRINPPTPISTYNDINVYVCRGFWRGREREEDHTARYDTHMRVRKACQSDGGCRRRTHIGVFSFPPFWFFPECPYFPSLWLTLVPRVLFTW